MENKNIDSLKIEGIGYLCNCYYKSKIKLEHDIDLIDVINDICYINNEKDIKEKISKFVTENAK